MTATSQMATAAAAWPDYFQPIQDRATKRWDQLEADLWGLLDQKTDLYSFILINPEGGPVESTGVRLRAMRDGGELTIHPATYRLVYDLDD